MKKIFGMCILLVFICVGTICANASEIKSNASVTGKNVTISGYITDVNKSHRVTLLIGSVDNIVHIDQKGTDENGNFKFEFQLPKDLLSGTYTYKINSSTNAEVHSGIIEYTSGLVEVKRKFIEADVDVTIIGYRPTIEGTVCCTEGKTIEFIIRNITDNTIISDETITSEDGVFNISYTLPSLLDTKEYEVTIVCSENNTNLANLSVVIDSSILLIDILGTATIADNVSVNTQLQSVDTDLINKNATFTGNESVSVTIPNLVLMGSFRLSAKGYETVAVEQESLLNSKYIFNGTANEEKIVAAMGNNITTFENKIYEITYDKTKIKPVDLHKSSFESALNDGENGTVEIISNEPGKIKFKMVNIEIPNGEYWSGVMHIFKFKNILTENITTQIEFREER